MKAALNAVRSGAWCYSLATISIAVIIGMTVLNPLWAAVAHPNMFRASILPPITAPIDGIFYIRNAELGYGWSTRDPFSLWFHPLLSWLLQILPEWQSTNIWFWFLSIAFAVASLPLVYQLTRVLTQNLSISPRLLPLCLLAPGGLGMATGNAEIPTLFFSLALLLSVLLWQKWWLTLLFAIAAILTKPNGLYMVPILLVYFMSGMSSRNDKLWKHSLLGIAAILAAWMVWIWIVDLETGYKGAYWEARESFKPFIAAGDPWTFFQQAISSFVDTPDTRNQIRFSTALLIPIVNLLIIGLIPLRGEQDRYAMAAGNLAMLAITLYLGNPNKIIVYTTTLPGHFVAHLLFLEWLKSGLAAQSLPICFVLRVSYMLYCGIMLLVYIFGTPLAWYH